MQPHTLPLCLPREEICACFYSIVLSIPGVFKLNFSTFRVVLDWVFLSSMGTLWAVLRQRFCVDDRQDEGTMVLILTAQDCVLMEKKGRCADGPIMVKVRG